MRIDYDLDIEKKSTWDIINPTSYAKSSLVYMDNIGDFFANQRYYTDRDGLDSFLIKLTLSGKGYLKYGGQSMQLEPGQIFWIDCNYPQNYGTDKQLGHWHVIWVHFNGTNARTYYELFLKNNNGSPLVTLPINSPVLSIIEQLISLYTSGSNCLEIDIKASGLLTQLMVECVSAVFASDKLTEAPTIVQAIRSYLLTSYTEKITLNDLANKFNLNQFYLQKLFKRYVGQSPTEYLIHLRMSNAKKLMRSTHLSIGEIAYTVGFENMSHFTRQFKSREGMTPQEYRKVWPIQ